MARKLTKGCQKVPLVKMEKKSNLQVSFSKRRNSLFKKASELCTLTGAEVAVVVFSPGQKAYSFGHPCFESIIDKYTGKNPSPSINGSSTDHHAVEANHQTENVVQLNQKLTDIKKLLEDEKRGGEVLDQMRREGQGKYWWLVPIGELNLEQLQKLDKALDGLVKNIEDEMRKRRIQASNLSRYLFEMGALGRNVDPSTSMGVPFGVRASVPGGFSPFGAMMANSPAMVDPNSGADGTGPTGGSNMTDGNEPSCFRKFF